MGDSERFGTSFFYWVTGVIFDRVLSTPSSGFTAETWELLALGIFTAFVGSLVLYDIFRPRKAESKAERPVVGFKFYHDRSELSPLPERIQSVKSEVVFMGGSVAYVAAHNFGLLTEAAKRGVKVKLMVLPPNSIYLPAMLDGQGLPMHDAKAEVEDTLRIICHARSELGESDRARIEIVFNNMIPFYSIEIRDGETADGVIRIEPFIYKGRGVTSRPSFEIRKRERPDEFSKYWNGYLYLLSRSTPYTCPKET